MGKKKTISTRAQSSAKKARNGKIELLRFLFALVIAVYHLGCSVEYDTEKFKAGYLAVEFYFLVSGYLFASSLSKKNAENGEQLLSTSLSFMWKKYLSFAYDYLAVIIMTSIAWIPYFHLSLRSWLIKMAQSVPTFLTLQMFGFKTADWYVPVWYLSAMMIAMFVLTPVLLKYGKFYSLYVSPVLSLVFLGFIFKEKGTFNVSAPSWEGFINLGMMRAFAEISIGCTCFYAVKSGVFKRFGKYILSAFALIVYALFFLYMAGSYDNSIQPAMVLLLVPAAAVTFYNTDTFVFLNNKFVYFLGRLSLPVFLCHSIARYYTLKIEFADGSYMKQLLLFLAITMVLSLCCMAFGEGVKKFAEKRQKI